VDALGWAEERREELKLRQAEGRCRRCRSRSSEGEDDEDHVGNAIWSEADCTPAQDCSCCAVCSVFYVCDAPSEKVSYIVMQCCEETELA
jgi:hypothetical protein